MYMPAVLQVWFKHPLDYRTALREIISCDGDSDTTGAIPGAIVGSGVGREGIPMDWLKKTMGMAADPGPDGVTGSGLTEAVRTGLGQRPAPIFAGWQLVRNLFFMAIVLAHGLRRLLPPY